MAPPKKWEPPPSHLRKVECRCCGVKIFERNYSVHLKNKHKHDQGKYNSQSIQDRQ